MPAHCTSTGKALLAELTDQEVMRLYPDEKLVQMTPRSVSTRTELLEALARVRPDGYARAREESEDGVASVAMAVKGIREPGLAINVSVPVSRVDRKLHQQIVQQLRAATNEVEASLS